MTEADVTRQTHGTTPTSDWVLYTRDTGTGNFRTGPGTPPLGSAGSLELATPLDNDKAYLFNYDHNGTKLTDIDAISYSTYRTAGNLQQVAGLNIEVDFNGAATGGYTVLVFEPMYNTSQGAVVSGQWQNWDAYDGGTAIWWSSRAIPGACAFSCYVTWNNILTANPDAIIGGGFGVNQGGGNPGLTTAIDALTIGYSGDSVTYNFELIRDTDSDGIADGTDNCPTVVNPGQANNDGDSQGDACDTDDDNDTVADGSDNCQFVANTKQADQDGDEIGDACDPDDDGDGKNDTPPPTSKDQCKNGNWATFNNPSFKNQGQCVAYVNAQP